MSDSPSYPSRVYTLVDLLRERASQQPELQAYTFLTDGEEEACDLTYRKLDQRAQAIGALLQSIGAHGAQTLLLYPPGLEYIEGFFGCLYAGTIAIPAYPPRSNQSLYRLRSVVADAQVTVVLTTKAILGSIERRFAQVPELESLRWLITDQLPEALDGAWQVPATSGDALAMLQYTSGTTGAPKGVMVSHGNLLHNAGLIHRAFKTNADTRGMIWLPPYHDMGLIGGILQPLYGGFPVTLMSPYTFLQRPLRWLQAISRFRITASGGPDFAYELCVRRVTMEQLAALDLSTWELAFNGAEPIHSVTLERFVTTFAPCGFRREAFYPCYGLAEATLFVTGGAKEDPPVVLTCDSGSLEQYRVVTVDPSQANSRSFIGCGQSAPDQTVVIVNLETESLCSPGRVGEIWVSGPSVALGYWNRPEETAQTFRAYLKDTGAGPFLRTGDLGFLQSGELFVTGRLKDLIIIRGRNYYPQDIELTVEQSHPALRRGCGAAFSVEVQGEERLVVVQEVERQYLHKLEVDEVIGVIRRAVGEFHELQIHAVVLLKTGSIPKTSSGKIQRRLCRERFLNDGLVAVSARSQFAIKAGVTHGTSAASADEQRAAASQPSPVVIQAWLVSQLAEQLKVAPQEINVRESFIHHGLDSVAAVGIFSKLEDWLGRRLPPNLFWDYPNVESLAGYLVGESNGLNATDEVPREYYRFELFPEYRELQQLRNAIEGQGVSIPYFKPHGRVAADTTFIDGREFINFSSYNYLGMSGDPFVSQAAKEAIDRYGTSVSASRLVSGERPLHHELETAIAELIGAEDCIVYVGGHSANVTTISHLLRPGDLILYDALSHNSVLQGCSLSGARSLPFPHNDWQALDEMLREHRRRHQRVLIVIEGVYSMDGDIPDLPQFIAIKRRHKALLMIDEAHSMGVLGEHGYGVREYFGIAPDEVDLWMGTLSKSFASCGGYIAASRAVIEYLKYTAPGFVYSVGISPPNAASALAAIQLLKAEPERVARLHERARLFLALTREYGLNNGTSKDSPVVPVIVGDSLQCILLSRELLDRGINVQPIIYPAVEERASRLRFFISSTHTEEQIRFTVCAMADAFALVRDKLAAVDRINSV